jgi:uncharacterized phage protein (TIGR02216 family)
MSADPWRRWLPLGLGVLGLNADQFWRLSLAEWRAMLEGHAMRFGARAVPALGREDFTALQSRYPDKDSP